MAAAADRHLLFGLLALQNGLIDQGQLVAAFQAWTRDKARSLADHLVARGDLDADAAGRRRGDGRAAPEEARRRREEPRRGPGRRVDPRAPGRSSATRTSSATLAHVGLRARLDRARDARPHRHLRRRRRRPATASGSASSGRTPGAGWGPCSWRSTAS